MLNPDKHLIGPSQGRHDGWIPYQIAFLSRSVAESHVAHLRPYHVEIELFPN